MTDYYHDILNLIMAKEERVCENNIHGIRFLFWKRN